MLGGRIQALARAHDQITSLNWAPVALKALVELEAGAYLGARAGRIEMDGPEVALDPKAFATLALVVHEMMTNSAKYGALADSTGKVEIAWKLDQGSSLVIDWKESGGPPVQPPSRRGFGTTIIERSIPFDLKGDAELRFDLLGVHARFVIPANYVEMMTSMSGIATKLEPETPAPPRLSGTALIVEDNLIIAMAAEVILLELGARHVETAASVKQALAAIERAKPDFALLDLNLGSENSIPVASKLRELDRSLHLRHRLWRAGADPGAAGRSPRDPEALYQRRGGGRARQAARGAQAARLAAPRPRHKNAKTTPCKVEWAGSQGSRRGRPGRERPVVTADLISFCSSPSAAPAAARSAGTAAAPRSVLINEAYNLPSLFHRRKVLSATSKCMASSVGKETPQNHPAALK